MLAVRVLASLLALSLPQLCTGGDGSKTSSSGTVITGRGTAVCQEWKTALCAYRDRCHSSLSDECRAKAPAVVCKTDAIAKACADQLTAATCDAVPSGCDLLDVTDPAPAVEGCTHFVDTFCLYPTACGQSLADCKAGQLAGGLDCTKAIGLAPAFDDCDADVKTLACGDPLPPSCSGTIVF
jgi:hypothetical protein